MTLRYLDSSNKIKSVGWQRVVSDTNRQFTTPLLEGLSFDRRDPTLRKSLNNK